MQAANENIPTNACTALEAAQCHLAVYTSGPCMCCKRLLTQLHEFDCYAIYALRPGWRHRCQKLTRRQPNSPRPRNLQGQCRCAAAVCQLSPALHCCRGTLICRGPVSLACLSLSLDLSARACWACVPAERISLPQFGADLSQGHRPELHSTALLEGWRILWYAPL